MFHLTKLNIILSVAAVVVGTASAFDAFCATPAPADIESRLENLRGAARAPEPAWPVSRSIRLKRLHDRIAVPAPSSEPRMATKADGTVSGTVSADAGTPLADIDVHFHADDGSWAGMGTTGGDGSYSVALAPGFYYALTFNTGGYVDELHADVPQPADFGAGILFEVTDGGNTTVDFALAPGYMLYGSVTDAATGAPLDGIEVSLRDPDWQWRAVGTTGADGQFSTNGAVPGEYYAVAIDHVSNYVGQAWSDIVCPDWCDLETVGATVIEVTGAGALELHFALDLGGVIQGRFRDADTGADLAGIGIDVYDAAGEWIGYSKSDSFGMSWTPALPVGSYKAVTTNHVGYLDELYDDLPCVGSACDYTPGDDVVLTAGNETVIELELDRGHQVVGTVTDAATGDPIPDVGVDIFDGDWNWRGVGSTDDEGRYASTALLDGTYYAVANNWGEYIPELHDDVYCPDGWNCDLADGTPLVLGPARTTRVADFSLDVGGEVSGRVFDAVTGAGLADVWVSLQGADWNYYGGAGTDVDGFYTAMALPPGLLYATTFDTGYHVGQLYDAVPCPGGWNCDLADGTPIPAVLHGSVGGIDFGLDSGGPIFGSAEAAWGAPAVGITVFDPLGRWIGWAEVNDAGDYVTPALLPGSYRVTTYNEIGCVDELFDDLPLGWADLADGTPVPVAAGADTLASFVLDLPGEVCGSVFDAVTGAPIGGAEVRFYRGSVDWGVATATAADGTFVIPDLPRGDWYGVASAAGYASEAYDGVRCEMPPCDPTVVGQAIVVSPGGCSGSTDFLLDPTLLFFEDGFESGNTSAWSLTVGGS